MSRGGEQSKAPQNERQWPTLRRVLIFFAVYFVLLIASSVVTIRSDLHQSKQRIAAVKEGEIDYKLIPPKPADPARGLAAHRGAFVYYLTFGPGESDQPPVILIHGSPGQAHNFDALGPELARLGRRAYAIDLPGFGDSSTWLRDYSARTQARRVLDFMDAEGIERAHVVGWSSGGAVALNIAEIASETDRIATVTLLSAIACQETEGSGDYYFEHAKYAAGYFFIGFLPNYIPHFGLFGQNVDRLAFIRSFWDTDQRPIRAIMESLGTPTLILHGRNDPLVSDWAAERHHELIPTSRLIMTPYSHFMPFLQAQETAGYLGEFFDRHDLPGVVPLTDELILAPKRGQPWFRAMLDFVRGMPWPLTAGVCALLALLRRESATAIAGLFVGHGVVDFGVAMVGLFAGRLLSKRNVQAPRRGVRTTLATLVWSAVSLLIAQIALSSSSGTADRGPIGVAVSVFIIATILWIIGHAPTRWGRRRLIASVRRILHHEWWPSWVLYAAIFPHLLRLAARHRSLTIWTCVNPGIRPGGGIIGESKLDILNGLDPACALTQIIIEPDPDQGARHAKTERTIEDNADFLFPVVFKPEAGERGDRVTIVRTGAEIGGALRAIPGSMIIQKFHPGPIELGVFWIRDLGTIGHERTDSAQGSILAITRKILPELVCDGERTIRAQILAHKRYRMQAEVYLENLAGRLDEIPAEGKRVLLTEIGNHIRGCRFEDGADLITPELSAAIDRIARTWRSADGEPFDFGRFDIRCSSDEAVRAGEDLAVIELNGVTSEATNLYDPSWSPARALKLLARQWTIAFEIGAARRALGARPMSVPGILGCVVRGERAR